MDAIAHFTTALEALQSSGSGPAGAGFVFLLKRRRDAACAIMRVFNNSATPEDVRDELVLRLCRATYGVGGCRDLLDVALMTLGSVPEGVKFTIELRGRLLRMLASRTYAADRHTLRAVDAHMRGAFARQVAVETRPVPPTCAAPLREFIMEHERVQRFRGASEFITRFSCPYRRCFGLFHPSMPNEPLVFVQTFLSRSAAPPAHVEEVLAEAPAAAAFTSPEAVPLSACFFAVTNTQSGLAGLQLASYLLFLVMEVLQAECPTIQHFFTLSPMPNFRIWLEERVAATDFSLLTTEEAGILYPGRPRADAVNRILEHLCPGRGENLAQAQAFVLRRVLMRAAARYVMFERRVAEANKAIDPVTNFHVQNGATVHRINLFADARPTAWKQSFGVMVNYKYDTSIAGYEAQRYARFGTLVASKAALLLQAMGVPDVLRGLSEAELNSFETDLCARVARPGEWLVIPEDASTHAFYVIALGRVELYTRLHAELPAVSDAAPVSQPVVSIGDTAWFPASSLRPETHAGAASFRQSDTRMGEAGSEASSEFIYGGRADLAHPAGGAAAERLEPFRLDAIMRVGNAIGALSAITGQKPRFYARAATQCHLFVIPVAILRAAFAASPSLAEHIRHNAEAQLTAALTALSRAVPRL